MKFKILSILFPIFLFTLFAFKLKQEEDSKIISYVVDTKQQNLQFYWKDDKGNIINTFEQLKNITAAKKQKLVFAMNGGMFKEDYTPLGLFIQNQKEISSINKANGKGNFYLKPNGVFYITTNNEAVICNSTEFKNNGKVKFATQSGPMLLIDGKIHAAFTANSKNLNIRNGVGILPNGKVIFAISKAEINFYDFANFFKKQGCKNALYLDGFVSRIYLPEKNIQQMDGKFGVMIGVVQ
jgi:uncharacterized protein YigE (DUF2233 family)